MPERSDAKTIDKPKFLRLVSTEKLNRLVDVMLFPASRDLSRSLTVRHIRIVAELEATRSLSLSAENLGVSYAAISKALIEIENITRCKLFERSMGTLVPTERCFVFLASGKQVLKEMSLLSWRLGGTDTPLQGRVRIAFQAPAIERRFVGWCAEILQLHPGILMSWEYISRPEIFKGLDKGTFDIGIGGLIGIENWARLDCHVVSSDYYFFIYNMEAVGCDIVFENWDIYKDRLWVLPLHGMAMREYFNMRCKDLCLPPPSRVIEVNSPHRVAEMLLRLDGMTIMASSMWDHSHTRPPPLVDSQCDSRQGLIWNKDRAQSQEVKFVLDTMLGG